MVEGAGGLSQTVDGGCATPVGILPGDETALQWCGRGGSEPKTVLQRVWMRYYSRGEPKPNAALQWPWGWPQVAGRWQQAVVGASKEEVITYRISGWI